MHSNRMVARILAHPDRAALMRIIVGLLLAAAYFFAAPASHAVEIQSICRVKGQEPVRLVGLGLVVGLNGSGDTRFTPAQNALARAFGVLGNRVGDLTEVTSVRNAALVMVQCTVPGVGGREGDMLDCFVSSTGTAKSLEGGRLVRAELRGVVSDEERFYALAEGPITIELAENPTTGRIEQGAKLTEDFFAPFLKSGDMITLVIDESHASFVTANRIAAEVNQRLQPQLQLGRASSTPPAIALDARNIEVHIPAFAQDDVVSFIADVMSYPLDPETVHTMARVVVNERAQNIVVTGEVQLSPVLISQRNLVVFPAGQPLPAALAATTNGFVALTPAGPPSQTPLPIPLQDLLDALNRAQASAADKIAIIRELDKSGKLHAKVIYE